MKKSELRERLDACGVTNKVSESNPLPTHCSKCGLAVYMDTRAGELWHADQAANLDHRPEFN